MSSNVRPDAIWVVLRQLRFVQGGAVSVPLKTVTDQKSAEVLARTLHEQFETRVQKDPAFGAFLAEIGVNGYGHHIGAMAPPDSLIVQPPTGLVVPQ